MQHHFPSITFQSDRGFTITSEVVAASPVHPATLVPRKAGAVAVEGEKVGQSTGVVPTGQSSLPSQPHWLRLGPSVGIHGRDIGVPTPHGWGRIGVPHPDGWGWKRRNKKDAPARSAK